jgi:hypothetical protein
LVLGLMEPLRAGESRRGRVLPFDEAVS